ncbi:MAG: saccharopine dehydrogenase family protein [Lautropia sp.]|nr:saccharopine dehydrogenase family protein [Lautropia sp.]
MKKNVLIIGAGGVGHVVAHKLARHNSRLGRIHLASRSLSKCQQIIDSIHDKGSLEVPGTIEAHRLDATDSDATRELIRRIEADIVINVGHAFINMSVLRACIDAGAAYLDTAIHEDPRKICEQPPWYANYEWKHREECAEKGVTAILGIGFDPGVVNAYAALGRKLWFDQVDSLDIIDINAGSHGRYFATNFNPEINFREFTGQAWTWQKGQWVSNKMFEVRRTDNLPVVGEQTSYLTGHDEIHSLSQLLDIPTVRFWMGFGEHYINVFTVLNSLGLLSEQPVTLDNGQSVVPLQVVKAVLPDPSSLAPDYRGKTCIGSLLKGRKDGRDREIFIYNICDHAETYREIGSQAISYTAGVPAAAAALLIADGRWDVKRMANVEELPPLPLLSLQAGMGLVTRVQEGDIDLLLEETAEVRAAQNS